MKLRNLDGYGLIILGTVMVILRAKGFDMIQMPTRISKEQTKSITIFIRKFLGYVGLSALFISLGLIIGIVGYHWAADLSWIDSLVEASMILSGMGPISPLSTVGAKVFASLYALFSGLIFVIAMGIVLSPLMYTLLSKLQVNLKTENNRNS